MPRRPEVDRRTRLQLRLPESIRTRLDLLLFSELEGRVPQGRYQAFFIERIREYLTWKRLDLSRFGLPQGYFVAGPREMIGALERHLETTVGAAS